MDEIIFIVEEAPEGGFSARALDVSIVTEADSRPELREAVRDAVHCHFDAENSPKLIRLPSWARWRITSGYPATNC